MSEVSKRGLSALRKDSFFAGQRGDVEGRSGDNRQLAEGPASRREAPVRRTTLAGGSIPDPEVPVCAKRRRFSAAYKVRVVEEAEGCAEPGEIGALLRREGLYSSQLSKWRQQYRAGALQALRDDKRGRKARKNPLADEVARLRKQNEHLGRRLEQAEAIIEIQKKVAAMLGIPLNSVESEEGE